MKELQWKVHEGFQEERPLDEDTISSPTTVYLRRNIEEVPNVDTEGEETGGTHWRYEEAELTLDEYWQYCVEQNQIDMKSKIDYIAMMTDVELD